MTQRQTARAFRHRSAELCLDRQKAPPGMTPDPRDRGFRSIQVEHAVSAECILRRSMRGLGRAAPCTRGSAGRWPATSEATAEATAKAGDPWNGGVGPVARDAVNPSLGAWPRHPCRGHPRNRTHPPSTDFRDLWMDPRHAWMNLCQISKSIRGQIRFPTGNGSDPMTPCRSRINPTVTGKLSMAPSSPHGRVYGVSCQSTPHRQTQTTQSRFGFGSCRPAAGTTRRCRAQPCRPPPCARKRFH